MMPTSSRGPRPRQLTLAAWIAGVSLLALLPLLLFTTVAVYRQITAEQERAKDALQRRADNAAEAVGQELGAIRGELHVLAQAASAQSGDLAALHEVALRVVATDPRITSISLSDAEGRLLFSTREPYGTPLPRSTIAHLQRSLFERGDALVSPLVVGAVSRQQVVVVAIAARVGVEARMALRAAVRLDGLNRRLADQHWPAGWVAAVIDQNRVIVARSRDAARFVGLPITPSLREGIEMGGSVFEASSKDGIAAVASVAKVPGSNWLVAVGLPLAVLNAPVRESMAVVLVAGTLCALLGIGGAVYFSRYLGRQLREVVDAHTGAATGDPPVGRIREVSELAQALMQARGEASRALRELEDARSEAVARLEERSEMLNVLAHEVRQPLHNASAALQAATSAQAAGGEAAAGAAVARANAVISEVQASINNTLAAASLLVGAEAIWQDDTDIDALVAVAVADLPPREAGRVRIERATATRTATMNASLMRLALRNLMSNALKSSPPGSPVEVRISDSDEPLALLIDVIDHGSGIAGELMPQLFERRDRRKPEATGRRKGLGLYIVRRVMELHGGTVQVLRSDGAGTTMRLVIAQGIGD